MKPSRRKEMAQAAVATEGITIKLACAAFSISESCYRYQPKLSSENAEITGWLMRLTEKDSDWGFRMCFYYLLLPAQRAGLRLES